MTVKNTFRVGSTCHRAFHHLELNGRTTGAALAKSLDFDEDELPGLLGLALRSGHIRRAGEHWEIGDGLPPTTWAPSAPPPAAPPPIQTAVVPPAVRELPAAAPKAPPKAVPKAPPKPEPVVLNRPPAQGVDIDRVHIGKTLATVRPPKAAEPAPEPAPAVEEPFPPSPTMAAKAVAEDALNRQMTEQMLKLPTAGASKPPLRLALWSDGALSIDVGGELLTFDADETDQIAAYLRRREPA